MDHTHSHSPEHAAGHQAADGGTASWRTAAQATLHCLTGCAIGEVLGMVIGTASGLSNALTIAVAIVLAFFFGYALTMRGVLRAGVGLKQAVRIALAADTLSILVMELIDNAVLVMVPGAMDAHLATSCSGAPSPSPWLWPSCSPFRSTAG